MSARDRRWDCLAKWDRKTATWPAEPAGRNSATHEGGFTFPIYNESRVSLDSGRPQSGAIRCIECRVNLSELPTATGVKARARCQQLGRKSLLINISVRANTF